MQTKKATGLGSPLLKSADDIAVAPALNRSLWREGQGRVRPGLPAWRFWNPTRRSKPARLHRISRSSCAMH